MSSIALSRSSISKQRGAEMSSRLIPPKLGASRATVSMISSMSVVSRQIGTASTPPNCLNSTALPSITGIAAAGPMSPRPSTAVPSVTTATVLRHPGVVPAERRVGGDRLADPRDARGVGQREVLAAGQRDRASGPPSCRRRAGRRRGRRRTDGRRVRRSSCLGQPPRHCRTAVRRRPGRSPDTPADRRATSGGRARRPHPRHDDGETSSSGTTPRWRESTPSPGLSLRSHQPGLPPRGLATLDGPLHRQGAVGEAGQRPAGRSATGAAYRTSSRSPGSQRRPHRVVACTRPARVPVGAIGYEPGPGRLATRSSVPGEVTSSPCSTRSRT